MHRQGSSVPRHAPYRTTFPTMDMDAKLRIKTVQTVQSPMRMWAGRVDRGDWGRIAESGFREEEDEDEVDASRRDSDDYSV